MQRRRRFPRLGVWPKGRYRHWSEVRADPNRRCLNAAYTLLRIDEAAAPAIVDLLKHGDRTIRKTIIDDFVMIYANEGPWEQSSVVARAIEPLLQTMAKDEDPEMLAALARLLLDARSEDPTTLSTLRTLLRDPAPEVRLAAAGAFAMARPIPDGLRGSFLELLNDGDQRVRIAATKATPQQELTNRAIIDRLLATLEDPDVDLREAAAQKLAEARYSGSGVDAEGRPTVVVYTSTALSHSPTAGAALRSALASTDPQVRTVAASLLPVLKGEATSSISLLVERLRDPNAGVRAAAAKALGQFGTAAKEAVRALLGILANTDDVSEDGWRASFNAAAALESIGGEARAKMLHLLMSQLNSLNKLVRIRASQILVNMKSKVSITLFRTLSDSRLSHSVRAEIVRILHSVDSNEPDTLISIMNPPVPEVLAAVPALRSLARDGHAAVRLSAAGPAGRHRPTVPRAA